MLRCIQLDFYIKFLGKISTCTYPTHLRYLNFYVCCWCSVQVNNGKFAEGPQEIWQWSALTSPRAEDINVVKVVLYAVIKLRMKLNSIWLRKIKRIPNNIEWKLNKVLTVVKNVLFIVYFTEWQGIVVLVTKNWRFRFSSLKN